MGFLEPRRDQIRLANNPFSESERIAEGFAERADGDRWFDTASRDNLRNIQQSQEYSTFLEPRRDLIRLADYTFSESERIAEGFAERADGDRWFDTAMRDNLRNMRSLIMDSEEMLMEVGPEEELINEWR